LSHSHATESQGLLSPFLAGRRYKYASYFVRQKDIVIDLGCGSGRFKDYLSADAQYFGVDSEKRWTGNPAHLFRSTVEETLPKKLQSKKFTVATALAVIEHLKQPAQLFDTAYKVLSSGGRLILTTPHPIGRNIHDFGAKVGIFSGHASEEHETFLDKEDLASLAEKNGFEMTDYRRFILGMNQVAVFIKK
jgi:SAM-dependent methyltransferase